MTYCNTLFEPLIEKIEIDKKTLDEIADEVCGDTVKNPRQKIIRIIKVILGEEYLIEHAQTLGYNTVKAVRQKSTTCEVVNRKIVTEEVENEDSDNSRESESVTPISPCKTTVQPVNMEQVEDAGETTEPKKTVEDLKDEPEINVPNELFMEIKRLIGLYSLKDVQTALELAKMDI